MKKILLFLLIIMHYSCFAQDEPAFNKINVSITSPLQFIYNNSYEMLSQKVIPNALELGIKIKQEHTSVYAQAAVSGPHTFPDLLALRLTSKSSPNAVVSQSTLNLTQAPVLLFTQPASSQSVKHYSFFYDLLLNPSASMIPPGNYNFSISFTITAQ